MPALWGSVCQTARCAQEEGKQALDDQRHLFLRNQEDLSAEDEQSRAVLAAAFPELGRAWQLKEALRTWYATASADTAAAGLDAWIAAVKRLGPKELRKAGFEDAPTARLHEGAVRAPRHRERFRRRRNRDEWDQHRGTTEEAMISRLPT